MTERSPSRRARPRAARIVGLGVGADAQQRAVREAAIGSVPALAATIEDGLALLESGHTAIVVGGPDAAVVLDLGGSSRAYAELRGWATLEAAGAVDVERARIIRRAMADGGLKAVEIGHARIVVRRSAMTQERAIAIFDRALGRYAADVAVQVVDEDLGPEDRPPINDLVACVLAVARSARPGAALLVRLGAAQTVALAFGRPR